MRVVYPAWPIVGSVIAMAISGFAVYLTAAWSISEPSGSSGHSRALITLIGAISSLLFTSYLTFRSSQKGFNFRYWGGSRIFSVPLEPNQPIKIGPFRGVAGRALIVDVMVYRKDVAPPARSFKVYSTVPLITLDYHLALFGRVQDSEVLINEASATRDIVAGPATSNEAYGTGSWQGVVFPVDQQFDTYFLRFFWNASDVGEAYKPLRVKLRCTIGLSRSNKGDLDATSINNVTAEV